MVSERAEAAKIMVEREIALFDHLGAPLHRAQLELMLARIEKESNNLAEALVLVDKVMKFLVGPSEFFKAEVYFLRGELCWALGQ